jgi:hypothetical protein
MSGAGTHKHPGLQMHSRSKTMKTLMTALVAMAVLAGIAAPASAACGSADYALAEGCPFGEGGG